MKCIFSHVTFQPCLNCWWCVAPKQGYFKSWPHLGDKHCPCLFGHKSAITHRLKVPVLACGASVSQACGGRFLCLDGMLTSFCPSPETPCQSLVSSNCPLSHRHTWMLLLYRPQQNFWNVWWMVQSKLVFSKQWEEFHFRKANFVPSGYKYDLERDYDIKSLQTAEILCLHQCEHVEHMPLRLGFLFTFWFYIQIIFVKAPYWQIWSLKVSCISLCRTNNKIWTHWSIISTGFVNVRLNSDFVGGLLNSGIGNMWSNPGFVVIWWNFGFVGSDWILSLMGKCSWKRNLWNQM